MKIKNQNGFTLLELVVVISILGILMVISLPQFTDVIESAEAMQVRVEIMQARVQAESYLTNRLHWGLDDNNIADDINSNLADDITFKLNADNDDDEYEYKIIHEREFGDKKYYFDSKGNEIIFEEIS